MKYKSECIYWMPLLRLYTLPTKRGRAKSFFDDYIKVSVSIGRNTFYRVSLFSSQPDEERLLQ